MNMASAALLGIGDGDSDSVDWTASGLVVGLLAILDSTTGVSWTTKGVTPSVGVRTIVGPAGTVAGVPEGPWPVPFTCLAMSFTSRLMD